MKTSLMIFPCVLGSCFSLYKILSRLVLCYKKYWATLLHFIYFCYLLLVTNYPITKLSVTTYFSTCREYLAGNRLSFPSAPRWVRHSYLSKGLATDRSLILVGHHQALNLGRADLESVRGSGEGNPFIVIINLPPLNFMMLTAMRE